jgi:hypothetical protein
MIGKTGSFAAVAIASWVNFSGQAQAQCSHSNNSQQIMMMQGYSMQQKYAVQQVALLQAYLQQAVLQQNQQQAILRQQQGQQGKVAVLKTGRNQAKVEKDTVLTLDLSNLRSTTDASDETPVDPEQAAASSLKLVQPLVADPSKRTFARLLLHKVIDSHPKTAAADEARKMLAQLQ